MAIATKSTLCYYVDMTQFIVSMTPAEYRQSQKRKAAKMRNAAITTSILLISVCSFGYWALWGMVHN